jgi:hypothetical protein
MVNAKYIYFAQIISSGSSVLRIFLILSFFGLEALGLYSLFFTIITLLSLPGQILNNQAFQIFFIKKYRQFIKVIIPPISIIFFSWVLFILFTLSMISLFYTPIVSFDQKGWVILLFISTVFSLLTHALDLLNIVKGSLVNYYVGLAVYNISNIILILFFYFILNKDYILFLPAISSGMVLFYYWVVSRSDFNLIFSRDNVTREVNFKSVSFLLRVLKKTWYINSIPFVTALLDFGVKSTLAIFSSVSTVGAYQIILSVEAMIGNLFLGPFYKNIILKFALKQYIATREFVIYLVGRSILLTLIPILGILVLGYMNYLFEYKTEFSEVFLILLSISFVRVLWSIWGVFSHILLTQGRTFLISNFEIFSRFSLSFFFVIGLIFIDNSLWLYVYSSIAVGIILAISSLYFFLKLESKII